MRELRILLAFTCVGLVGCAGWYKLWSWDALVNRKLTITYHSDPEGAMLYANESRQLMGYTPVTVQYQPSVDFYRKKACLTIQPSMVRWASGAEASGPSLSACPQVGFNQQFVFLRPTGLPGREIDAQFALQLRMLAVQQELAEAQRQATASQAWSAFSLQMQQQMQQYQSLMRTVHCTSRVVGYTVYTDCR